MNTPPARTPLVRFQPLRRRCATVRALRVGVLGEWHIGHELGRALGVADEGKAGVGVLGGEGKVRVGVRIRARFPAIFLVLTAIAVTVAVDGGSIRDRGRTSSTCSIRSHTPATSNGLSLFVFLTGDGHPFEDLHRSFADRDPFLLPAPDTVHRQHELLHIVLFAGSGLGSYAAGHRDVRKFKTVMASVAKIDSSSESGSQRASANNPFQSTQLKSEN